jgi:exopolyphosphatase/guanosine-5'-triphosphate,3'-diphosphate pyrophosphatase
MPAIALLECGSNSLKIHFRAPGSDKTQEITHPWRLGHEVFRTGTLSPSTIDEAQRSVDEVLDMGIQRRHILAVGTEVLREANSRGALLGQLRERLDIKVRVLSPREEASLLAEGYLRGGGKVPACLLDLGGGSLQIVRLLADKSVVRDSFPLGAIRLHALGEEDGRPWNVNLVEAHVDSTLAGGTFTQAEEVHAAGGTVKAVAKVLGREEFEAAEVLPLLEKVRREGPPPELSPQRREVFFAGLIVLERALRHLDARRVLYLSEKIGSILLERILDRLGTGSAGERRVRLLEKLRLTNIPLRLPE